MSKENKGKPDKKLVTIIVEATPHEVPKGPISYEEIVKLEVPSFTPDSQTTYSVIYERGQGNKPEGTLCPGSTVKVKEGMVFHVSETGQS
ncbi:multiubiquitin domain-containing protein [Oceanicoccus sp. KOV_DT_Chl]|uniref:multiubiquitin domain-containing protein n=1 Tax=Oceanicoccus sp. KOV_DT_Chl TaxID=1904639 RepID=UPI000C7A24B5|nr:multiubiquitin domain-containing protein [Oceanicoccus sp. KOV_DT_Chl]